MFPHVPFLLIGKTVPPLPTVGSFGIPVSRIPPSPCPANALQGLIPISALELSPEQKLGPALRFLWDGLLSCRSATQSTELGQMIIPPSSQFLICEMELKLLQGYVKLNF